MGPLSVFILEEDFRVPSLSLAGISSVAAKSFKIELRSGVLRNQILSFVNYSSIKTILGSVIDPDLYATISKPLCYSHRVRLESPG